MRRVSLILLVAFCVFGTAWGHLRLRGSVENARHGLCAFILQNSSGQWQLRVIRISSVHGAADTTTTVLIDSLATDPQLVEAGPGGNIYLGYIEHQKTSAHAYVKVRKSTDKGVTWTAFAPVTTDSSIADGLRCVWESDTLYLFWKDCRNGKWEGYSSSIVAP